MYTVFVYEYNDDIHDATKVSFVPTIEGIGAAIASEMVGKARDFAVETGNSVINVDSLDKAITLFGEVANQKGAFSGLAHNGFKNILFAVSPAPQEKFPIIEVVLVDHEEEEVNISFFREYRGPYFLSKTLAPIAEHVFRLAKSGRLDALLYNGDVYAFDTSAEGLRNYLQRLERNGCLFDTEITVSTPDDRHLTLHLTRVPMP